MKSQQLQLIKDKADLTHGGSKRKGKRKTLRPLTSKKPIHLVLKAHEPFQLLRSSRTIEHTLKKYSLRFGITLHATAVQADHLHLNLTIPNRDLYRRWIRAITSVLVAQIKNLKWRFSPFTRIVSRGRDFKTVCIYIRRNQTKGSFMLDAHERVDYYREEIFANLGLPIRASS